MEYNKPKFLTNEKANVLHTGELLTTFFKEKRVRISPLARIMNRQFDAIKKYQKNASIQTAILWEISVALKHNFFQDIANMLPPEFGTNEPKNETELKRIADLEHQILLLENERDTLYKVMKNKE